MCARFALSSQTCPSAPAKGIIATSRPTAKAAGKRTQSRVDPFGVLGGLAVGHARCRFIVPVIYGAENSSPATAVPPSPPKRHQQTSRDLLGLPETLGRRSLRLKATANCRRWEESVLNEAKRDYRDACRELSVPSLARDFLHGNLDDGISAAVECCDRWAEGGRIALNWIGKDFAEETVTFGALREQSSRFANALRSRGIGKGDVVAGLLPRIPELLIVVLGVWRVGAIYQPLFTAFGPAAIASRVTSASGSQAKLIVTDETNGAKLEGLENSPSVLLVDRGRTDHGEFAAALAAQSPEFAPVMLRGNDPFVMLFTSGTTGSPKGVRWPLRLLLHTALYMRDAVDLRPEDRFWNVADPGWAYGMGCGVVGPLQLGHATTFYEGAFTVDSALRVITSQRTTALAAAPTVYRMMMAAGDAAMAPIVGQLRVACSAGEPLNPEVVRWADRVLRAPLADHYGQTESWMTLNTHHGLRHKVKAGAAGLPMQIALWRAPGTGPL
jgi:acetyl-CoA synthetase